MDLKAAYEDDSRANRLTRAGMLICFLITGTILVANLTFAKTPEKHFDTFLPKAAMPK